MESEEIQGRLLFPNIAELDLSCNKLVSLSSDIGEHVGLKILSLRGNTKLKEVGIDVQICEREASRNNVLRISNVLYAFLPQSYNHSVEMPKFLLLVYCI